MITRLGTSMLAKWWCWAGGARSTNAAGRISRRRVASSATKTAEAGSCDADPLWIDLRLGDRPVEHRIQVLDERLLTVPGVRV